MKTSKRIKGPFKRLLKFKLNLINSGLLKNYTTNQSAFMMSLLPLMLLVVNTTASISPSIIATLWSLLRYFSICLIECSREESQSWSKFIILLNLIGSILGQIKNCGLQFQILINLLREFQIKLLIIIGRQPTTKWTLI